YPTLPVIKGFYEDKAEEEFETVVINGAVTPGFKRANLAFCSTSVTEYGGFNRKKAKRESAVQMYDPGSLFHLSCDTAPTLETLNALMQRGLGIRQAEEFGQVLFLSEQCFRAISQKRKW
ncbi:MAG: hypothetical protein LUG44_03405, partial [Clostridiales bacterium]|nr:hypothetical protein [Clostridiales bacterium]